MTAKQEGFFGTFTWGQLDKEMRHLLVGDLFSKHGVDLVSYDSEWWRTFEDETIRASPIDDAMIDYSGVGRVLYHTARDHFSAIVAYAILHELSHVVYGRAVGQMDPEEQDPEHLCAIMALDWKMCRSIGLLGVFWRSLADYSVEDTSPVPMPDGTAWFGLIGNAKDTQVRQMLLAAFKDGIKVGVLTQADMDEFVSASCEEGWRNAVFKGHEQKLLDIQSKSRIYR